MTWYKTRNVLSIAAAAVILCSYLLPASLAWSAAQSLWIANFDDQNVLQVKPSISLSSQPIGIAFDKSGNEWVTVGSTDVQEFTAAQLKVLAKTPAPAPHTVITSSSWTDLFGCNFDKNGDLWLADEHGALDELSHAQLAAGSDDVSPARNITSSSFKSPIFLAFDKDGDLWVSDEDAYEIFEFTPAELKAGGILTPNITISGHLADPGELAFDADGNLWVANYASSSVVEFAKSSIATSGSPTPQVVLSSTSDSLAGAWGLAFDGSGDLWIANYAAGTIVEFDPGQITSSGSPTPIVTVPQGLTAQAYQITFGPSY
jgi:DNA-binding beta-propeller fold protein YncE